MEYLHIFIDFFANGKSEMKVYLFFIFLLTLGTARLLRPSSKADTKKIEKTIVVLIFVLFAFNLASFAYFFSSNNIPYVSNIYIYNNGEVSSANILHNHTLKAPIGFILEKIGISAVREHVDTGLAFTSFFSPVFLYMTLALVLALLCGLILYVRGRQHTPLQTLIFSVISFSILKNIFDGGFFHIETILALPLFLILIKNSKAFHYKEQKNNTIGFAIYLCAGTFLAYATSQFLPLHGNVFAIEFLEKLLFFFALFALYYHKQISRMQVYFSVGPAFLIITIQLISYGVYQHQVRITNILPAHDIIASIKNPLPDIIQADSSSTFGDQLIVEGHARTELSKTELLVLAHVISGFDQLSIVDIDCDPNVSRTRSFETRKNAHELEIDQKLFHIKKTASALSINESSCLYVNQTILKEIFRENGISSIILIQNDTSIF